MSSYGRKKLREQEEKIEREIQEMKIESKISAVQQNYTMFKEYEHEFKKKTDTLKQLDVDYQDIYLDVKQEYDRLRKQHFEGTYRYYIY